MAVWVDDVVAFFSVRAEAKEFVKIFGGKVQVVQRSSPDDVKSSIFKFVKGR
jgi:hypothetical protein